jgi:hypothetical protein
MGSLDIPEVLIILGLLGSLGLAVYNWTHQHPNLPRHR